MAKGALGEVLRHVRTLAAAHTGRAASDRELLERFASGHDEAAFAALVERHGPMVLGVCRRALGDAHDAEDACQATFLVLARKADSVRKAASLGSWLHGVACRVAAGLRREQARRRRRERGAGRRAPADPCAELAWREVQAALDEELGRLPERYRAPLVLCYLEGSTRDEAARQLGLSVGSLHGRLERGRTLLRGRLARRGLGLSAALLAAALSVGSARGALPPTLVLASARAAVRLAAGHPAPPGDVPANVLTLAQEVLKNMFVTKLKAGAALVLCVGLLTAAVGGSLASVGTAREAKAPPPMAATTAAESDADFIRRMSKDLRGSDPTPAEFHFFVSSKETGKRQRLIDLLVRERQAKKEAEASAALVVTPVLTETVYLRQDVQLKLDSIYVARLAPPGFAAIQADFYKEVLSAAREKKEAGAVAQRYLDRLLQYVKENPKADDVPDAVLQVVLVYGSQGKDVEADAWRKRLVEQFPDSRAARAAQQALRSGVYDLRFDLRPSVELKSQKK